MEKHDRNDEGSVNPSGLLRVYDLPYIIWLFTESNFPTFVVPNTTFGILGALAGHGLTTQSSPGFEKLLMRLPLIILFNWATVFIFDLANQRLPESVQEDLANKPWRPIPTGKVTREQTRRGMLIAIPLVLALNTAMGVWRETSLIFVLTWLYNDLKGGDEIIRDLIISVAFGLYNHASLKLAVDADTEITQQGYIWITLISGVILTTMQVQDLKDQAGDKGRDRRTIPLVFGDSFSRWSIAWLVLLWSPICVLFWGLNLWAYAVPMSIGFYLVFQVLGKRDVKADAKAWRLWCLWIMVLYVLPVIYCSQTVIS